MNKYVECAKEIDTYFKTKGYKPNRIIGVLPVFAIHGIGATNMYFYGFQFEGNIINGRILKNINDISKWEVYVYEHIKSFLEKWNIEDRLFVFSGGGQCLLSIYEMKIQNKIK